MLTGLGHGRCGDPTVENRSICRPKPLRSLKSRPGDTFERGSLRRLFSMDPYPDGLVHGGDISSNGQQFCMIRVHIPTGESLLRQNIDVVLTWFEVRTARVPMS